MGKRKTNIKMKKKKFFMALTSLLCSILLVSCQNPKYLTFTAEKENSSFSIVNVSVNHPDVQYSLDGGKTWIQLNSGDSVVLRKVGDKALLKGMNPMGFSENYDNYSYFKMTGDVAASGSVMSLIDGIV